MQLILILDYLQYLPLEVCANIVRGPDFHGSNLNLLLKTIGTNVEVFVEVSVTK